MNFRTYKNTLRKKGAGPRAETLEPIEMIEESRPEGHPALDDRVKETLRHFFCREPLS